MTLPLCCRRCGRPVRSLVTSASQPDQASEPQREEILALRRQRLSSPVIARQLNRPVSTAGVVLRRNGLGRLASLDPRPAAIRYQRQTPGEFIHIDIKKLGRINGTGIASPAIAPDRATSAAPAWEYVPIAVDDASRLAYTELLPNEHKESAVGFTARVIACFANHGAPVERIMADNGSACRSRASARQRQGRAVYSDQLVRVGLCVGPSRHPPITPPR